MMNFNCPVLGSVCHCTFKACVFTFTLRRVRCTILCFKLPSTLQCSGGSSIVYFRGQKFGQLCYRGTVCGYFCYICLSPMFTLQACLFCVTHLLKTEYAFYLRTCRRGKTSGWGIAPRPLRRTPY